MVGGDGVPQAASEGWRQWATGGQGQVMMMVGNRLVILAGYDRAFPCGDSEQEVGSNR